jgi:peptidoglycan hydrolase-like protein with peptidoglycan-binding domain
MRRLTVIILISILCPVLVLASNNAPSPQDQSKPLVLVKGLDGGTYEPYSPAIVQRVQKALKAAGLYQGEENGILDDGTMKAIGDFQEKNGLKVSGVPTPNTRKLLLKQ